MDIFFAGNFLSSTHNFYVEPILYVIFINSCYLPFQVKLRNSLTNCVNNVQVENQDSSEIPEAVAITGQATATGFLWNFPEETKMTITPYLKCLAGTNEFFDLPNNLFGNKNIVHISDYYRTIKPGKVFYLRVGFKFQPPEEYRKIPHTTIGKILMFVYLLWEQFLHI